MPRYAKSRGSRRSTGYIRKNKKAMSYRRKGITPKPRGILDNLVFIKGKDFMPQEMMTRFNYTEKVTFSVVSNPTLYYFRGNSGFDPNQTGTGNQPVGWDNMNTFYTYCECYASRIMVTWINGTTVPMEVVLAPVASTTENIDFAVAGALPKCKRGYIGSSATDTRVHSLTNYATVKDLLGIERGSGSDVRSTFLTNPAAQFYWATYQQATDTATAMTFVFNISITYFCILSGRKVIAQST